ncbi:MAG: hypothetical protein AMXMBFR7_37150 [Planctomycetota bacterium]
MSVRRSRCVAFSLCVLVVAATAATGADSEVAYNPGPDGWWLSKGEKPHKFIQPEGKFRIQETRPRLMLRAQDLSWIKERIAGPLKPCWDAILEQADGPYGIQKLKPEFDRPKNWAWDQQYVAAAALITGERKYVDWCIAWAKKMAGISPWKEIKPDGTKVPGGSDTFIHTRMGCMAYVYDWLYDKFTPEDRKLVLDGLVEHMQAMYRHPMVENPGHTGGHDRSCLLDLGAALIATYPDYKNPEMLAYVRNHIHGLYGTEEHIARDGGFYMGWGSYTCGYTINTEYLAWTTGTNDVLLDDWMGELAWWYIYGLRGDGLYPPMEDHGGTMPIRSHQCLYATHFLKNGHARWFYEQIGFGTEKEKNFNWFLKLLWWDDAVPAKPLDDLPTSRAFRGCGNVICRDRWDDRTTHFVFRSVPFSGGNHRHKDQNGFVIHYRGDLAVDQGKLGITNMAFLNNTLAHNCITVRNPAARGGLAATGGQIDYPPGKGWKRTLEQIVPGGESDIRGLFRYEAAPDLSFTYMAGEASKVYDPKVVKLCQRDAVYLKDAKWSHPIIVIFDRIESVKPEYEKRFLLHTVAEPKIEGSLFTAVHNGGKLYGRTVWPLQSRIEAIGGPGKEHWAGEQDWPPTGKPNANDRRPDAAWRIEVRPVADRTLDYLLHVFCVADAEDETPAPPALAIESETAVGVETCGWTVVFPKSAEDAVPGISYAAPQGTAGSGRHLIVGLRPNAKIKVAVADAAQELASGAGGCVSLKAAAAAGAKIEASPVSKAAQEGCQP